MWLFVHVIKGWKCMCFDRNERECTVLVDFWWLWGGNLGGNACGLKLCEWLRWMCMSACEICQDACVMKWIFCKGKVNVHVIKLKDGMHVKGWRLNVCWCDWMIKVHVADLWRGNAKGKSGNGIGATALCGVCLNVCNDEMDGSGLMNEWMEWWKNKGNDERGTSAC